MTRSWAKGTGHRRGGALRGSGLIAGAGEPRPTVELLPPTGRLPGIPPGGQRAGGEPRLQLLGALEPPVGILRQATEHDLLKVRGDVGAVAGRGHDRVAGVGVQHVESRSCPRTGPARQEAVRDASQSVQVARRSTARSPVACSGDMYCGVPETAPSRPGPASCRAATAYEAEVEQLDEVVPPAAPGGEDVRRLDVAVDQAGRMRLRQRLARLPQQVDDPAGRQRPVPPDQLVEAQPVQVLHDVEERAVLGPAVVVDLHGVRVRQPGRRADLVLEPGQRPGVAGPLRADQLQAQGRFSSRCSAR